MCLKRPRHGYYDGHSTHTSQTLISRRTFNPHVPDTDFTTDIQPTRPRHWYYDGHSTNKAPQVIQITWHLITTVSVTKLFLRIIIIFHHNPRSLVWSWHEFKTSVAIEVGVLHSQPFTNSDCRFLILLNRWLPQLLLQRPRQVVWHHGVIFRYQNCNLTRFLRRSYSEIWEQHTTLHGVTFCPSHLTL